jgi:hypothetical protein
LEKERAKFSEMRASYRRSSANNLLDSISEIQQDDLHL